MINFFTCYWEETFPVLMKETFFPFFIEKYLRILPQKSVFSFNTKKSSTILFSKFISIVPKQNFFQFYWRNISYQVYWRMIGFNYIVQNFESYSLRESSFHLTARKYVSSLLLGNSFYFLFNLCILSDYQFILPSIPPFYAWARSFK